MHMNIYMLTGDNQLTANAIASELGIEAIGEVLPQDKKTCQRITRKRTSCNHGG